MADGAYKFRAFLSYSRKDEAVVQRLHRRLEAFDIPRALRKENVRRLGRIFRDKDELAAASELGAELTEKIEAAEWLIVCCSPAAAQSQWVNAEVESFIAKNGTDRVLAAIMEGEPHDVFPAALRGREPLAADFRKTGDGEDLGFLKLVAGILDVDLGELRDRQAAAERARTRNRAILAGVFAVLAVVAGISAAVAVEQSKRATAMASEAIDIGAGVVTKADDLSRRFGVPTSAVEELLTFAATRFERLFAEGVQTQELQRQRATVLVQFAELYGRIADSEKQRDNAQQALAMFERFPPDQLRTLDYVRALAAAGQAELAQGREGEATGYTTRAIEAARAMIRDIPDARLGRIWLAGALQRQGEIHMNAGRAADALPLFTETVALLEPVRQQTPNDDVSNTNYLTALDWLGGAQAATRNFDAATQTLTRTANDARAWSQRRPDSLAARATLGSALMKLGQTLVDQGKPREARAPLLESIAIARALSAADPRDGALRRDLALRLMLAANALAETGDNATPLMVEAIDMARAQVREDPANTQIKETLARMLAVRAARFSDARQPAQARPLWREIAALRRELRAAAPANAAQPARDLAYALEMAADQSAQLQDLPSMLSAYGEAATLRRAALAQAPQNGDDQRALAAVLHALGLSKKFNQDAPGAIAALTEAAILRAAVARANPRDGAIAFAAVESYQQAAVVQSATDGAAARASFDAARTLLRRLVADHPNEARYADSLRRTEEVIASIDTYQAGQRAAPEPEAPAAPAPTQ